jgi:DNA helicase HerA-like ATPase
MEKMLWSYCFDDVDGKDELRQDVESILGAYSPNLLFSKRPVLAPPDLDGLQGIRIGRVVVGDRETFDFNLSKNDFTRHVAIYAQTGHGKTSLLYCLMDQFLEKKIPFLYIDLKKDGRALLRKSKELIVIPWSLS